MFDIMQERKHLIARILEGEGFENQNNDERSREIIRGALASCSLI
jgi:hypothetical protein